MYVQAMYMLYVRTYVCTYSKSATREELGLGLVICLLGQNFGTIYTKTNHVFFLSYHN